MEEELKNLANKLDYKLIKKTPSLSYTNKWIIFMYLFFSIFFILLFSINELNQYIDLNPEIIKSIKANLWKITFTLGIIGTIYLYIIKKFQISILLDGLLISSFLMFIVGFKGILGEFGLFL